MTKKGTFDHKKRREKDEKDTFSRLFSSFLDSGGPSLHLWPEPAQGKTENSGKQRLFCCFLLFSDPSKGVGHAQWPGHALVHFLTPRAEHFQKSESEAKIRFI